MLKPILALVALCCTTLAAHAEIINIDNAELARLASQGVPVIDIRTEGEWKSSGVIAGSKLITLFDENGRANPPEWLEKIKAVAKPEQPVILLCRSGNRTRAATQFLSAQAGYTTVYNLSKGINTWISEGRPLVALPMSK